MALAASQATTLAVATANDLRLSNFAGQSVDGDDVIINYTWSGDANLSGLIDADDFFQIDSHYNRPQGSLNFFNGDFDYDGNIDGDDYFQIDTGYQQQNGTLSAGVVSVPEPPPILLFGMTVAFVVARRTRRVHLTTGY
jgi:hypothetical protein